jgi:hypothetical protein
MGLSDFLGNVFGSHTNEVKPVIQGMPITMNPEMQAQQQAFLQALKAQSQGQGPSLATTMLQNQSAQNAANANSLISGQRGMNAGLAMRNALNANANANQAMAGQAAQARVGEQLGAMQNYGNQLNATQQQDINVQHANQQDQMAANQLNTGIAMGNTQTNNQVGGGIMSAAGSVLGKFGMAHGGVVPQNFAGGGEVGAPLPFLTIPFQSSANPYSKSGNPNPYANLAGDDEKKKSGGGNPFASLSGGSTMAGGPMDAMGEAGAEAGPAMMMASEGGKIPGQAKVEGDSLANDTVPTMLSPGEIVIPRTHSHSPESAKAFVEALLKKKKADQPGKSGYSGVLEAHRKMEEAMEALKSVSTHSSKKKEPVRMAEGGEVLPWQQPEAGSIGVTQLAQANSPYSMDDMIGSMGPNINAPSMPAGSVVASNSPSVDRSIASDLIKEQAAKQSPDPGAPYPQPQSVAAAEGVGAQPSANPNEPKLGVLGAMENAFKGQKEGMQALADAQSQQAKDTAKANDALVKHMEAAQIQYQKQISAIDADNAKLQKDIQEQKIDPNRLWNNASTAGKISASIGIILGGIGAGLQGSNHNVALDLINKSIDRDIDAQKSELGKKQGLLSMNMQKYHNATAAQAATRLQFLGMAQAQIAKAAATSGSAQAQANAKIAISQIGVQEAQLKQQLAMMGIQNQQLGQGGGEGGLPVGQEPTMMLTDPKYQEKRVVVNGRAYQAPDHPAAEKLRAMETKAGPVMHLVHQLDSLGPSALIPGSKASELANAIRDKLATEIPQTNGLPRINETEIHQALGMINDPTSFRQMLNGGVRNSVFFKNLADEMESARQHNLIGYKGMSKFNVSEPVGR